MTTSRPVYTEASLLALVEAIKDRPELELLYEDYGPGMAEEAKKEGIFFYYRFEEVKGVDFNVLYPDTCRLLELIQHHFIELRYGRSDPNERIPRGLAKVAGVVFNLGTIDMREYETRTQYFHDLVDAVEARLAALSPNTPIPLKRFPFFPTLWRQTFQTADGTKAISVEVDTYASQSDEERYDQVYLEKPAVPTPDAPYVFDIDDKQGGTGYRTSQPWVWYASTGPASGLLATLIANWIVSGETLPFSKWDYVLEYGVRDGFKEGPLDETPQQMRERFDREFPLDDE
jgi:hypothetical protein